MLKKTWLHLHNQSIQSCTFTDTWILDNETSSDLQHVLVKNLVNFQLVPTRIHRAKLDERGIQTFKNFSNASLSSLHQDFPITEGERFLPQPFITLKLIDPAKPKPKLFIHAYIYIYIYMDNLILIKLL